MKITTTKAVLLALLAGFGLTLAAPLRAPMHKS